MSTNEKGLKRTPIKIKTMVCTVLDNHPKLSPNTADSDYNALAPKKSLQVEFIIGMMEQLSRNVIVRLTKQDVEEIASYLEKL